jgi:hypothetical protein
METKNAVERVQCPKCRKDGCAKWQEGQERKGRKLIGLTAGFKSIDKGGRDGTVIVCAGCGTRIMAG